MKARQAATNVDVHFILGLGVTRSFVSVVAGFGEAFEIVAG